MRDEYKGRGRGQGIVGGREKREDEEGKEDEGSVEEDNKKQQPKWREKEKTRKHLPETA